MNKGNRTAARILRFYRDYPIHDPTQKTPASDEEEISLGDLTVPSELTEIRKSKAKTTKKIIPFQPSDKLEENLDRNMIEKL